MYLENKTDENIYIAAGIFVPARGTLTVSVEMHDMVTTSPLIADYVKAGDLELHGAAVEEPATPPAQPAASKVAAADTKASEEK